MPIATLRQLSDRTAGVRQHLTVLRDSIADFYGLNDRGSRRTTIDMIGELIDDQDGQSGQSGQPGALKSIYFDVNDLAKSLEASGDPATLALLSDFSARLVTIATALRTIQEHAADTGLTKHRGVRVDVHDDLNLLLDDQDSPTADDPNRKEAGPFKKLALDMEAAAVAEDARAGVVPPAPLPPAPATPAFPPAPSPDPQDVERATAALATASELKEDAPVGSVTSAIPASAKDTPAPVNVGAPTPKPGLGGKLPPSEPAARQQGKPGGDPNRHQRQV